MKRLLTLILLIGATMTLSCCSTPVEEYKNEKPELEFDKFFTGPVQGWGIVQSRSGKVLKRFDIEMVGTWKGDQGTLDEVFTYYDGTKWERSWNIKKLGPKQYVGTASDIIGDAPGKSAGNAINFQYVMKVPVGDTTYNLKFDDWMYLMNGDVIVNKSVMKKFGIKVGELTIFMQKKK